MVGWPWVAAKLTEPLIHSLPPHLPAELERKQEEQEKDCDSKLTTQQLLSKADLAWEI